ncbi:MAG: hypothetical protein A3H35_10090 [Betaproteobacteria bacterium RIFCSPLOWO2_02_FULL_62_17]|nr:MAG: hypothetical protein A3H35_10090 [Betaproteobacteria bacterium RIFCSPLOWO2_02_FULL_62_17]
MNRKFSILIASLALALPLAPTTQAQSYPEKPIRLIVPYPPGGIDPYARVMMPKMIENLGQQIILENRPGANGLIGTELVTKSPPDGYTILFATTSTLVGGYLMLKSVTWDPRKDLSPIISLFESLRTITVPAHMPIRSIKELIDYAKQNPGKLSFGSSGIGSAFHLDGEILKDAAGIDIVHVPYKGSGPLAMDVAVGRIEIGVMSYNNVIPHIKAGKLRLLAIMEKSRSPSLPGVPTVSETLPGVSRSPGWTGFLGPAGMPRPVVTRLFNAAKYAMESTEVRAHHEKMQTVVNILTAEEMGASMRDGLTQVSALMKKINLQPE